ncbi:hypothetical protein AB5I41_13760 [Sphingomonas sp. MMS24-JH45]
MLGNLVGGAGLFTLLAHGQGLIWRSGGRTGVSRSRRPRRPSMAC